MEKTSFAMVTANGLAVAPRFFDRSLRVAFFGKRVFRVVLTGLAVATFSLFQSASTVSAQGRVQILEQCEQAISEGDQTAVADAVAQVLELRNVPMFMRSMVFKCLKGATSEDWLYLSEIDRFVRASEADSAILEAEAAKLAEERALAEEAAKAAEEAVKYAELVKARVCELRGLVRQYDKTISEAEAARRDRRIETLSATVQECSAWFDEAPREALTNDTCNSIFTAGGLPNSTISGPSQLEEILAESAGLSAKRELEAVVSSGMLIEDYMAKWGSQEEADDSYNCSE